MNLDLGSLLGQVAKLVEQGTGESVKQAREVLCQVLSAKEKEQVLAKAKEQKKGEEGKDKEEKEEKEEKEAETEKEAQKAEKEQEKGKCAGCQLPKGEQELHYVQCSVGRFVSRLYRAMDPDDLAPFSSSSLASSSASSPYSPLCDENVKRARAEAMKQFCEACLAKCDYCGFIEVASELRRCACVDSWTCCKPSPYSSSRVKRKKGGQRKWLDWQCRGHNWARKLCRWCTFRKALPQGKGGGTETKTDKEPKMMVVFEPCAVSEGYDIFRYSWDSPETKAKALLEWPFTSRVLAPDLLSHIVNYEGEACDMVRTQLELQNKKTNKKKKKKSKKS